MHLKCRMLPAKNPSFKNHLPKVNPFKSKDPQIQKAESMLNGQAVVKVQVPNAMPKFDQLILPTLAKPTQLPQQHQQTPATIPLLNSAPKFEPPKYEPPKYFKPAPYHPQKRESELKILNFNTSSFSQFKCCSIIAVFKRLENEKRKPCSINGPGKKVSQVLDILFIKGSRHNNHATVQISSHRVQRWQGALLQAGRCPGQAALSTWRVLYGVCQGEGIVINLTLTPALYKNQGTFLHFTSNIKMRGLWHG